MVKTTKNMSWDDAINLVLTEAEGSLHYNEIAEKIHSQGLRQPTGATPAATVSAYLSTSIKQENSPYFKTGRGAYALKKTIEESAINENQDNAKLDHTLETGALRAFGMFWLRESVDWQPSKPKILGKQGLGATEVNFAEQVGVYLLHDRDRVIYVGRADSLTSRLRAHTLDRLNGRWDRFSWFGIRNVLDSGELADSATAWNANIVVETMEALLIESLEPPLNRKRGDNLSAAEYIQTKDPSITKKQEIELMQRAIKRASDYND